MLMCHSMALPTGSGAQSGPLENSRIGIERGPWSGAVSLAHLKQLDGTQTSCSCFRGW